MAKYSVLVKKGKVYERYSGSDKLKLAYARFYDQALDGKNVRLLDNRTGEIVDRTHGKLK